MAPTARKSTGLPAKKRKTLNQTTKATEKEVAVTSKRSRTSDAAEKPDAKRSRTEVKIYFAMVHI